MTVNFSLKPVKFPLSGTRKPAFYLGFSVFSHG